MTRIFVFSLFCAIAVKFMVFDIHGIDSQYKRILSKIIIRATKLKKKSKNLSEIKIWDEIFQNFDDQQ